MKNQLKKKNAKKVTKLLGGNKKFISNYHTNCTHVPGNGKFTEVDYYNLYKNQKGDVNILDKEKIEKMRLDKLIKDAAISDVLKKDIEKTTKKSMEIHDVVTKDESEDETGDESGDISEDDDSELYFGSELDFRKSVLYY